MKTQLKKINIKCMKECVVYEIFLKDLSFLIIFFLTYKTMSGLFEHLTGERLDSIMVFDLLHLYPSLISE